MEYYIMSLIDNEWTPCDSCNTMTKTIKQLQWYEEMDKESDEHYEYAIMVTDNDKNEMYMIYDIELMSDNNDYHKGK